MYSFVHVIQYLSVRKLVPWRLLRATLSAIHLVCLLQILYNNFNTLSIWNITKSTEMHAVVGHFLSNYFVLIKKTTKNNPIFSKSD